MLRRFRVHLRPFAAAALMLFAAMSGSELLPHEIDCHGDACGIVLGRHDGSTQRIGGTPAQDQEPEHEHCLLCHWARSAPRPNPGHLRIPPVDATAVLHIDGSVAPAAPAVRQPSLRAPPARPVHG